MILFIIGCFVGCFVGIVTMALCTAASRGEIKE